MKIRPTTDIYRSVDRVASAGSKGDRQPDDSPKKDQHRSEKEDLPVTPVTDETVDQAIQRFSAENKDLQTGIEAISTGHGPGLTVVLKDATGKTIRQLSGEEFIKLRENIESLGQKSGKILDQKI